MNETSITVRPIGRVASSRRDPEPDRWGSVESAIVLDPACVTPDAVRGLSDFSHVEVVYVFDRIAEDAVCRGARRPRGNPAWPEVGILAQRGSARPNRLGVTRCRLAAVDGMRIVVEGLDAIDGTPVLDVKPWFEEFGPRGSVRQPPWSHQVMEGYFSPP